MKKLNFQDSAVKNYYKNFTNAIKNYAKKNPEVFKMFIYLH